MECLDEKTCHACNTTYKLTNDKKCLKDGEEGNLWIYIVIGIVGLILLALIAAYCFYSNKPDHNLAPSEDGEKGGNVKGKGKPAPNSDRVLVTQER